MAINRRKLSGIRVEDIGTIDNIQHSYQSGSKKVSEVGRSLTSIPLSATTWTTDATTARNMQAAGRNIAVYNNHTAVHAVTFGDTSGVTAQAAGATEAVTGNAGLPCPPAAWSYFAAGEKTWVITDSNTLLVFLIQDDSTISIEANR